MPVGVTAEDATVAVNVTLCAAVMELAELASVVVVAAAVTVNVPFTVVTV
jgi:hypothetical protein